MRGLFPNSLTTMRLVAGLAFPFCPEPWWLPLVILGGLSDLFDGWLSRRWGETSRFGQVLDGVADKVFVLAVVVTLTWRQRLTAWELLGIAARDVAVTVCTLIAALSTTLTAAEIRPRWLGKATTAAQFVLLAWLLLDHARPRWMITVTIMLSVFAAFDYTIDAWRRGREKSTPRNH